MGDTKTADYQLISAPEISEALVKSYTNLPKDRFAGVSCRYRRYANFKVRFMENRDVELKRLANRPFFQEKKFSADYGGRECEFAYIDAPVHQIIADMTHHVPLIQGQDYLIRAHQIRTSVSSTETGEVTPEGPHRDGLDYIVMIAINRSNVTGGISRVLTGDRAPLFEKELLPGEALIIDDKDLLHEVTDICLCDTAKHGFRDMLLWGYTPWKTSAYYKMYGDPNDNLSQ